ncbi:MAG: helix-turn-helix domain-containing protein [Arachidicoccus sp.]|nr:helix-turn-helix domain-containing protein [Arachidicoccus sp.]
MKLNAVEPRGDLKQVVKQFWYTTIETTKNNSQIFRIMGDGAPGIIFQHNNGHSALLGSDGSDLPVSFAYGQGTKPCINQIVGNAFVLGVNFQPTAFKALFGINTSEITNAILDTEHLFSKNFNDQLHNTIVPHNAIRSIEEKLSAYLWKYRQDKTIDKSIRLIKLNISDIQPHILSSYFNVSTRQFQRKFKEYTGVSPETYIRIAKFQHSIHLLKNKRYQKLSDIGYRLNYADQSHFNREFKTFSGYTPKDFLNDISMKQPFLQTVSETIETIRIVKHYA